MIELVNPDQLIVGEKYYIKRKGNRKNSVGIFRDYDYYEWYDEYDDDGRVAMFDYLDDSNDHILDVGYDIESKLNEFYRFISREEFYKKMKEKYDVKCLDIILKRLINESFSW